MAVNLGSVNFGLGADTSGLDRAAGRLNQFGRTVEETERRTSGLVQSFRALSSAAAISQGPLSGVTSRLTAFTTLMTRFGPAAAGATVAVVGVATAIIALTTAAIKAEIEVQRFNQTIVALTGSSIFAADQFKFVSETADHLGLSVIQTARSFAQLSASTQNTALFEHTQEIFTGMSEALAAMQIPAAQAERAFIAISQMAAKGTVQMEELKNQLAEAMPGALSIFAKSLGVSTAQLIEMSKKGQVTSDALIKFAATLHNAFGPVAAKNVDTLTGAFNLLVNAGIRLGISFEGMTHIVEGVTWLLQKAAQAANLLAQGFDFVAAQIQKLGGLTAVDLTAGLVTGVNSYIDAVKVMGGTYQNVKNSNIAAINDQIKALDDLIDKNNALAISEVNKFNIAKHTAPGMQGDLDPKFSEGELDKVLQPFRDQADAALLKIQELRDKLKEVQGLPLIDLSTKLGVGKLDPDTKRAVAALEDLINQFTELQNIAKAMPDVSKMLQISRISEAQKALRGVPAGDLAKLDQMLKTAGFSVGTLTERWAALSASIIDGKQHWQEFIANAEKAPEILRKAGEELEVLNAHIIALQSGPQAVLNFEAASSLRDAVDAYTDSLKDANLTQGELNAKVDEFRKKWIEFQGAQDQFDILKTQSEQLTSILQSGFSAVGQTLSEAFTSGKLSMQDFGKIALDVLGKIVEMILQIAILDPILKSLTGGGSAIPGAGGGGGGGGGGNIFSQAINWIGSGISSIFGAKGLVMMQKGGIINQPTFFPMARGGAIGGESGPEAIMPLTRTSSGNLGVAAVGGGGGNVTVNVFNQSDAKVETKSSTDGRGQPQIDIMISKVIEKDIRQGGPAFRAITSMFGASPRVVQR